MEFSDIRIEYCEKRSKLPPRAAARKASMSGTLQCYDPTGGYRCGVVSGDRAAAVIPMRGGRWASRGADLRLGRN